MTAGVPTRTPFFQIALLIFAGLCAAGQFAKISIVFEDFRALYPGAGMEIGFAVSLLSLLGVALGLFAGLVVAQIGFRKVLLYALAGGALISLYQATLPPLPILLVTRAIESAAHLAIVVAAPTLVTALAEPRHHPLVMTLWSTIFGVTFALTAMFGIPLVGAYGIPALFIAHAVMLALAGVLLFAFLPRERIVQRRDTPLSFSDIIRRHVEVYTSPSISAPAAGFVFYALTYVALMTLLAGYIEPEWRAMTISAMPLISTVASLLSGATLLRRFSAVTVAIAGFLLGTVSAVLFIAFPGSPLIALLLFVALGLLQGASFASIPELNRTSESQALANGAVAQAGNVGNMLGTPILLAAASFGGVTAMLGVVAVIHLAGAGVHFVLRRKRTAKR